MSLVGLACGVRHYLLLALDVCEAPAKHDLLLLGAPPLSRAGHAFTLNRMQGPALWVPALPVRP